MASSENPKSTKVNQTWFDFLNKEEVRAKVAVVVTFFVLFFFSIYTYKTQANVTEFYFNSCLGKWRNPENAEGKPSVALESSEENYNLGNSAVLYSDLTEIYCGGLDEEIPKGRDLEKTTLKLAIAFSSSPLREANTDGNQIINDNKAEDIPTDVGTTTPEATTTENNVPQNESTTTTEAPADAVQNDAPLNVEVINQDSPTSFRFINEARAEEVPTTGEAPELTNTGTEATNNAEGTTTVTDEGTTTVTDEGTNTNDSVTVTSKEEDPIFMEIYYTLDGGKTLNLLDRISATNWKDKKFEYDIPITTWEDLSKFQVSLHGVSAVSNQPIVYLDSAWLVAEHKAISPESTDEVDIDKGVESGLYSDVVKSDNFDTNVPQDFSQDEDSNLVCDVSPFSQKITKNGSARFEVKLSDYDKPHRITFGKLPEGITIETDKTGGDHGLFFVISADDSAEVGSVSVSVLYELLLEDAKIDKSQCQFNVVVSESS